jgi:glutamine synthetase
MGILWTVPLSRLPIQVADPTTFRVLPWAPTTGWLLCDVYFNDGRPLKREREERAISHCRRRAPHR